MPESGDVERAPFSRSALSLDLFRLGTLLAELRYLDLALEYIRGRHHQPHAGPGPAYHTITIELGSTYPFTKRMGRPGIGFDQEEVNQDLAALAEQAGTWVDRNLETLRDMIDPIATKSAASHDTLAERLQRVKTSLETEVDQDFGELKNNLGDWKGDAAENFSNRFYHPFENVIDNQLRFVTGLMGALTASKAAVNYSQHSILNAVRAAQETVDEQLKLRQEDNTETVSARRFLMVGMATAGTIAAVAGGPPLWMMAPGLIGSGLLFTLAALPDDAETGSVEGKNAEELSAALTDRIEEIVEFVDREEGDLHAALRDLSGRVTERREAERMTPRRPYLADGVSGHDFYYRDSAEYPR